MGDSDSNLVVVNTFRNRQEAELAQSALEAAGIESIVMADDAGGVQPGFWESEPVRILVRSENETEARDVLTTTATPESKSE
jgi:hypothetical protein